MIGPEQLELFESPPLTMSYYRGLPDRSGIRKYLHLVRWWGDPKETMARGSLKIDDEGSQTGRDSRHWMKNKTSVAEYRDWIVKLLEDGEPRTFNSICVELTGTTADVWFEKAPDEALWSLVEDELVVWASAVSCTFFTLTRHVTWPTSPK